VLLTMDKLHSRPMDGVTDRELLVERDVVHDAEGRTGWVGRSARLRCTRSARARISEPSAK